MAEHDRNQGEGNREAARRYNEAQRKFVESGKVEKSAEEAKRAVQGKERAELRNAEEKGRSRAREIDPREMNPEQIKRP